MKSKTSEIVPSPCESLRGWRREREGSGRVCRRRGRPSAYASDVVEVDPLEVWESEDIVDSGRTVECEWQRGREAGTTPGYKPAGKDIVESDDVFVVQSLKRFDFIQCGCAHSFFQSPQLYALHCNDAARCLRAKDN
jgi:hypothetical protein